MDDDSNGGYSVRAVPSPLDADHQAQSQEPDATAPYGVTVGSGN